MSVMAERYLLGENIKFTIPHMKPLGRLQFSLEEYAVRGGKQQYQENGLRTIHLKMEFMSYRSK